MSTKFFLRIFSDMGKNILEAKPKPTNYAARPSRTFFK